MQYGRMLGRRGNNHPIRLSTGDAGNAGVYRLRAAAAKIDTRFGTTEVAGYNAPAPLNPVPCSKTGAVKEENPDFIKTGDAAVVTVKPNRPMVIEPYKDIPQLGRFAIRDMGTTIAAGMVMSVKTKK